MKLKGITGILLTLFLASTLTMTFNIQPSVAEPPVIIIDGDLSDWAGISPVATDAIGDTYQWSKNATILSVGATAEKPGDVAKNDMCRDLKALYFVSTEDYIYMRLDVAGLYLGWNDVSGHVTTWGVSNPPPPWPGLRHTNVSMYEIYFDLDPGGPEGWNVAAGADELNFSKGHQPDIYLEWDGTAAFISTMGQNPKYLWSIIMDNKNETGITTPKLGGIEVATDVAAGAFEFSFDRKMLESGVKDMLGFTKIGVVDVWVLSYKPGESSSTGWGMWRHVFDPQAPATHGEDIYTYAPVWPGSPDWQPVSEQYKPSGPWPPYTWTDPWGVGHNLTTSPASKGMDGVDSVTGQPITLTYPVPIDFADTFSKTNNLDTFTFAPVTPWDTKATLKETAKFAVDLTRGVVHDVAVISVTPSPTKVNVGESVNITVEVKNNGNVTETFNVTVSYDSTEIGTQTVTDLAAGATETLNFTWYTNGVAVGNYTIKAVAETVTGEIYTGDNIVTVTDFPVIPEFPTWASILLILVVLTVAMAIYRRRPLKTPIH